MALHNDLTNAFFDTVRLELHNALQDGIVDAAVFLLSPP